MLDECQEDEDIKFIRDGDGGACERMEKKVKKMFGTLTAVWYNCDCLPSIFRQYS